MSTIERGFSYIIKNLSGNKRSWESQPPWVNGGRLDLLLDGVKAKTDVIVASGATEANVDAVETKVDAVKAETALIVADTGEIQTDWVNGGRLDLLIDSIKAKTDVIVASGATEANVTTAVNDVAAVHVHAQTIETWY